MGYFECACQLCGVMFCVARIRREDEPQGAAWDYFGEGFVEDYGDNECDETCKTVPHDHEDEHIAGPNCSSIQGYSGWKISVEEMKRIRYWQCLVRKNVGWTPQSDDEEFELDSKCFLSGIGSDNPNEEGGIDENATRHDQDIGWPGNTPDSDVDDDAAGELPFHVDCFEIFKRISKSRLGFVDLDGLWLYRKKQFPNFYDFYNHFPEDKNVLEGREQMWSCVSGQEYLVATPILVPGLKESLENFVYPGESRASQTVFGGASSASDSTRKGYTDPFSELPEEVKRMLYDYLTSTDIGNLRLSSRVFRQLPNVLWRRLVFEDLPWLWEAHNLPSLETDWYMLYSRAKFALPEEMQGLRNRRRIWREVEKICKKISFLKSKSN